MSIGKRKRHGARAPGDHAIGPSTSRRANLLWPRSAFSSWDVLGDGGLYGMRKAEERAWDGFVGLMNGHYTQIRHINPTHSVGDTQNHGQCHAKPLAPGQSSPDKVRTATPAFIPCLPRYRAPTPRPAFGLVPRSESWETAGPGVSSGTKVHPLHGRGPTPSLTQVTGTTTGYIYSGVVVAELLG